MKTLTAKLAILLAVQLAILAGLWLSQADTNQTSATQPLLSFDPARIDSLTVADSRQSVTLQKSAGHWQLAAPSLSADGDKLNRQIDKLANLKTPWPVATSAASHARFKVSNDDFERRIELRSGEKTVATLLLGSSPGFRKVHARRPADDAVYAVELNSFDWPASEQGWLDKSLLRVDHITALAGSDFRLSQSNQQWQLDNDREAKPDEEAATLDQEKASRLIHTLQQLRVAGISQKTLEPTNTAQEKTGDDTPGQNAIIRLEVTTNDGHYLFQLAKAGDQYLIKRDDINGVFSLNQKDFEQLSVSRSALLATPPTADSASQQ